MVQTSKYTIHANVIDILKRVRQETLWRGDLYLKDIREEEPAIMVTCPFHKNHNENKPACGVFVQQYKGFNIGDYHCFACGAKGSITRLVGECLGLPEIKAEEWLYNTFGGERGEYLDLPKIEIGKKREVKKQISENKLKEFDYYHPYTDTRGLARETVDKFRIGYDRLTESITFPVWDEKGKLVFITERSVKGKRFNIPKFADKPLYLLNFALKENAKMLMVTEGQIDALTAWQYGFPCCATIGTPSDKQIETLNRCGIRVIISAFDNDAAGEKFHKTLKTGLRDDILLYRMTFPNGKKDINDLTEEEFNSGLTKIGITKSYRSV